MSDVFLLPLYNRTSFSYSTNLSNTDVSISFTKSARTGWYHFTVSLKDGTVVIDGMRMTTDWKMFTSDSFNAGLKGYFRLTALTDDTVESGETMSKIADNFIFSYVA